MRRDKDGRISEWINYVERECEAESADAPHDGDNMSGRTAEDADGRCGTKPQI